MKQGIPAGPDRRRTDEEIKNVEPVPAPKAAPSETAVTVPPGPVEPKPEGAPVQAEALATLAEIDGEQSPDSYTEVLAAGKGPNSMIIRKPGQPAEPLYGPSKKEDLKETWTESTLQFIFGSEGMPFLAGVGSAVLIAFFTSVGIIPAMLIGAGAFAALRAYAYFNLHE